MITSRKRGDNATERSAAQFVGNPCEQRTRKPVLRHDAEIAIGVDFVPDCRGPVGASAALRRSVVGDDDLGVLVCHLASMSPPVLSGLSRQAARSVFLKQSEHVHDEPRTGSGGQHGGSKQKQYNFTLGHTCTLQAPSFPKLNDRVQQQTRHVDENMSFLAFDQFARIEPELNRQGGQSIVSPNGEAPVFLLLAL